MSVHFFEFVFVFVSEAWRAELARGVRGARDAHEGWFDLPVPLSTMNTALPFWSVNSALVCVCSEPEFNPGTPALDYFSQIFHSIGLP